MHGALKVVLARTPSTPPLVAPRKISGSEGGTPPHGLLCTQRWSAADLSAAILFFSATSFQGIHECRLASFKLEDGAPIILSHHGVAAILAFSLNGLIPLVLVISL